MLRFSTRFSKLIKPSVWEKNSDSTGSSKNGIQNFISPALPLVSTLHYFRWAVQCMSSTQFIVSLLTVFVKVDFPAKLNFSSKSMTFFLYLPRNWLVIVPPFQEGFSIFYSLFGLQHWTNSSWCFRGYWKLIIAPLRFLVV